MYVSHVIKAGDLYHITHKYHLFRVPLFKRLLVKAGEVK